MGHLKNNSLIDEDVFFLLNLIEENGYKTRIVGGAVRDFLLHKKISDIDIVRRRR
jgi:tRNA nucleotidyltransferase/poly(A) polymerase